MPLSIVTPTRGNFTPYWFERLISIQGDVEFILVYPPGQVIQKPSDSRIKAIVSPYKGEVAQRAVGLLNASSDYVIALDDDDFLHPQVADLVKTYFELYPESLCLRLCKQNIDFQDTDLIERPWDPLPDVTKLTPVKTTYDRDRYAPSEVLREVPISPLGNRFRLSSLWIYSKRIDQEGPHPENFNNIVWKREIVKETVVDLLKFTQFWGSLIWLPFWNLDRLLGLYLQALVFQPDMVLGHHILSGDQVRYIEARSSTKGEVRSMFAADMILALKFPQYGYLWNLFFYEMWVAFKVFGRERLNRIGKRIRGIRQRRQ